MPYLRPVSVLLLAIVQCACGGTFGARRSYNLPSGVACLAWPMGDRYRHVSSGFHDPDHPFRAQVGDHDAIDLPAETGTIIRASAEGEVIRIRPVGFPYAASVTVRFSRFGPHWTYHVAHLSRIDVVEGQAVRRGQALGLSGGAVGAPGAGPYTTGPHLHFRLERNGVALDPKPYLCPRPF